MCGMNLAFDREVIGPAMYFGLMGEGQPWGRYDGEPRGHALREAVASLRLPLAALVSLVADACVPPALQTCGLAGA